MKIAVLALQGAFEEHKQRLRILGADVTEIRQQSDWNDFYDGLVIPGGESTVMKKLLVSLSLLTPVTRAIQKGMPVFGTCAGLILLSKEVDGAPYDGISTMDISTHRNAYGRQLGSFRSLAPFGKNGHSVPMTFIRAPYIEHVGNDVEVLSVVDGHIVAARCRHQIVTAFHPELDDDSTVHEYFLQMVKESSWTG